MKKVKFITGAATFDANYMLGKVYELEDSRAAEYFKAGLCKEVEAEDKPKGTKAKESN